MKVIERAMNTHSPRPTRRQMGGRSPLLAVVIGIAAAGQSRDQESIRALHRTILTVDSHVDTPMRMPAYDIGKRHPLGIGDVSEYLNLTAEMVRRGYSERVNHRPSS